MTKSLDKASWLLEKLKVATTPFTLVKLTKEALDNSGFIALREDKPFSIQKGKKYYVERNDSAVIAFTVPKEINGLRIISSHTDNPCFKIKHNPVIKKSGLPSVLNVESYGGLIISSWFDIPLGVAGRVFLKDREDGITIDLKDELTLIIPSLCIHQNRDCNKGWQISVQKEMLPLFSDRDEDFETLIAEYLGVKNDEILDWDLFLYNKMEGIYTGRNKEYISAPRLDDKECALLSLDALLNTETKDKIQMICLFDNEETGSGTRMGALSDFLEETIERITFSLGLNTEEKYILLSKSIMVSADNGHAVHPNYPEKSDITSRPRMNGGILLKYSASQKYTTNAESGAYLRSLMDKNNIPYQLFFNNSDIPGGSTLGNLSSQKVSIKTVDIGLAQLSMHSSFETGGREDILSLFSLFKAFLMD